MFNRRVITLSALRSAILLISIEQILCADQQFHELLFNERPLPWQESNLLAALANRLSGGYMRTERSIKRGKEIRYNFAGARTSDSGTTALEKLLSKTVPLGTAASKDNFIPDNCPGTTVL
ncbi:unnamed protein product [Anisakis simplex]|uniref:Curli production assembly/transport component CsgF n=1 Tax=Anisakis simplex TaxID=6269 RepID=A0A0M3J3F1_ANISI|nr:unnamed protein product [Anisakis simplex]